MPKSPVELLEKRFLQLALPASDLPEDELREEFTLDWLTDKLLNPETFDNSGLEDYSTIRANFFKAINQAADVVRTERRARLQQSRRALDKVALSLLSYNEVVAICRQLIKFCDTAHPGNYVHQLDLPQQIPRLLSSLRREFDFVDDKDE